MRLHVISISAWCVIATAGVCGATAQPDGHGTDIHDRFSRIVDSADVPEQTSEPGRRIGAVPQKQRLASPRSSGSSLKPGLLQTLAALGLVIGLILLLRWAWGKIHGATRIGQSPVVEVLSRTAVAPKNHVILLRVGDRILICGDAPGGLRTLAEVDDPEQVAGLLAAISAAAPNSRTRNFNQLLRRFHAERDRSAEGDHDDEDRVDRARDSVSGAMSRIRTLAGGRGTA